MSVQDLIRRVLLGEKPWAVLAEDEKPFSSKVTDKQTQITALQQAVTKAKDGEERSYQQAKLQAAQAELKHMQAKAAQTQTEDLKQGDVTHFQDLDASKLAQAANRLADEARMLLRQKTDLATSFFFIGILQQCQWLARVIYVSPGSRISKIAAGRSSSINHLLEQAITTIEGINRDMAKEQGSHPDW